MPPTQYDDDSSKSSDKNRINERAGDLVLPDFDSLPTAAGLTTVQAFQLSVRHALALLPAHFARHRAEQTTRANPERFSLP